MTAPVPSAETAADGGPGQRLALLLPDLSGGGAERVMLNLAAAFVRRGLGCDLVLLRASGDYLDQVPAGVNLVNLRVERARASVGALRRYLLERRPFGLVSALGHTNLAVLMANRLAGRPTRVLVSEHLSLDPRRDTGLVQRIYPRLARALYPAATAVVAVSGGVADTLAAASGLPRERIRVIYNPVITAELRLRAAEPVPPHAPPPYLLAVGRLTTQKNYPLLLEAFALMREENPDLSLVILGEGEERARLEQLAAPFGGAVLLPGFAANPYAAMRQCAAFVMSSDYEGLPTALIEALACGAPVVSTDCESGPREILEDGRLGALTPPGDAGALARAVIAALHSPPPPASGDDLARYTPDAAADAYLRALGFPS